MQFFEVSVTVMRVLGVWYDENTKFAKALLFLGCHTLLVATLMVLEIIFVFVSTDYNERIKSVGIITFHLICVCKVANAIRVEKWMQEALKLLNRDFKPHFPLVYQKHFERSKNTANRLCFVLLILFVIVSQTSLVVSYFNALTNVAKVMPYNHHHLFDVNKTLNFTLETLLQGYIIMFMTFCFICNQCQ